MIIHFIVNLENPLPKGGNEITFSPNMQKGSSHTLTTLADIRCVWEDLMARSLYHQESNLYFFSWIKLEIEVFRVKINEVRQLLWDVSIPKSSDHVRV